MQNNIFKRINDFLNVDEQILYNKGIHNGFILTDSNFYINPIKLENTNINEFITAKEKIRNRIENIFKLLKKSNNEGDNFGNAAVTLFTFDEPKFAALGLSIGSINGKGLTGETANRCLRTIKQIADSGYDNPEIIYAISVFNDNIRSDRVSDLLSNLLMKEILQYTQRMFDELGVTDMEEYQ